MAILACFIHIIYILFCLSYIFVTTVLSVFCQLKETVRSPYGSASTSNTFLPDLARPMPRSTVVIVLPTPPF